MTKTTSKVTLPKDVAEAVEYGLSTGVSKRQILTSYPWADVPEVSVWGIIQKYREDNFDNLARALYDGYEVEKSSEEKLAASYRAFKESYMTALSYQQRAEYGGMTMGIETALNTLGITIEGINDKEAK